MNTRPVGSRKDKKEYRDHWKKAYPRDSGLRRDLSARVCRNLLSWPFFKRAITVAVFYPLDWEPDLTHLWRARPAACVFPKADEKTLRLSFFHISSLSSLKKGYAGIFEPSMAESGDLVTDWGPDDLVLVPGLAFDRQGGRIGSGRGFYDRFLQNLPARKIGVCFDAQIVKERLAQDKTDVRMDGLCSETSLNLSLGKSL